MDIVSVGLLIFLFNSFTAITIVVSEQTKWRREATTIGNVETWTANQSGLVTLTFDILTLKVVSKSRVTWATIVQILVFLDLSVLDLDPMYVTDSQTNRRQTASLPNPPWRGHNK